MGTNFILNKWCCFEAESRKNLNLRNSIDAYLNQRSINFGKVVYKELSRLCAEDKVEQGVAQLGTTEPK